MFKQVLKSTGLASVFVSALMVGAVQAGDRDTVLESCRANLQLDEAGCACVADRSEAELSETQYAFFVSSVSGDAAANSFASKLSGDEAMEVMTFMTTVPTACKAG